MSSPKPASTYCNVPQVAKVNIPYLGTQYAIRYQMVQSGIALYFLKTIRQFISSCRNLTTQYCFRRKHAKFSKSKTRQGGKNKFRVKVHVTTLQRPLRRVNELSSPLHTPLSFPLWSDRPTLSFSQLVCSRLIILTRPVMGLLRLVNLYNCVFSTR